jgi:glyoxylase-like metal-dependent hydrolase (beta-lactamase superfamily II)
VTGDTLYAGTIYADYPSTDPKLLLNSYEKLLKLDPKQILPGHNNDIIENSVLLDAVDLAHRTRSKGLDHHGTGTHSYNRVSFRF